MRLRTILASITIFVSSAAASDVGKRFPSEKREIVDKVTGLTITALTTGSANDSKIYQTHPQWAADGKHIVFRAPRGAGGSSQAFAVNESTGEIIQLTDGPGTGTGSLNLAVKSNKLYYFRRTDEGSKLIELDLDALFADKDPITCERIITTLPSDLRESGGFGLDADERVAYVGVRRGVRPDSSTQPATRRARGQPIPPSPSGIRAVDLTTGQITKVIDTEFTMGHVQTNPWVAGEIIYCNETGGDAPQRMYTCKADGSGNRPLYVETPEEWITHEAVTGKDEVMFVIMAHQPRLRTRPTGIAVINLRNDEMRIIGQNEGRGFWHCQGSPDGRWAAGDDWNGNITVIDRKTGTQTLLSTDHKMRPDHCHPTFSPDSSRILIQSGLLSNGESLDLMIIPVPKELLGR